MPARPSAVDLLAALVRALGARRWYLFGAQAVNVHGRPRMTADVDVTVKLETDVASLVEDLRSAGFHLRVADPEEFMRATNVLPFMHEGTGMPLDVVIAGSGLESMFLDRAELHDVGGVVVPVISPSDLVVAKVLAGRAKDIEDAIGILRERPEAVDLAGSRDVIAQIERALDQSDLTPILERVIADAQHRTPGPDAAAPKRRRRASPRKR